jgi:hypothetical protein
LFAKAIRAFAKRSPWAKLEELQQELLEESWESILQYTAQDFADLFNWTPARARILVKYLASARYSAPSQGATASGGCDTTQEQFTTVKLDLSQDAITRIEEPLRSDTWYRLALDSTKKQSKALVLFNLVDAQGRGLKCVLRDGSESNIQWLLALIQGQLMEVRGTVIVDNSRRRNDRCIAGFQLVVSQARAMPVAEIVHTELQEWKNLDPNSPHEEAYWVSCDPGSLTIHLRDEENRVYTIAAQCLDFSKVTQIQAGSKVRLYHAGELRVVQQIYWTECNTKKPMRAKVEQSLVKDGRVDLSKLNAANPLNLQETVPDTLNSWVVAVLNSGVDGHMYIGVNDSGVCKGIKTDDGRKLYSQLASVEPQLHIVQTSLAEDLRSVDYQVQLKWMELPNSRFLVRLRVRGTGSYSITKLYFPSGKARKSPVRIGSITGHLALQEFGDRIREMPQNYILEHGKDQSALNVQVPVEVDFGQHYPLEGTFVEYKEGFKIKYLLRFFTSFLNSHTNGMATLVSGIEDKHCTAVGVLEEKEFAKLVYQTLCGSINDDNLNRMIPPLSPDMVTVKTAHLVLRKAKLRQQDGRVVTVQMSRAQYRSLSEPQSKLKSWRHKIFPIRSDNDQLTCCYSSELPDQEVEQWLVRDHSTWSCSEDAIRTLLCVYFVSVGGDSCSPCSCELLDKWRENRVVHLAGVPTTYYMQGNTATPLTWSRIREYLMPNNSYYDESWDTFARMNINFNYRSNSEPVVLITGTGLNLPANDEAQYVRTLFSILKPSLIIDFDSSAALYNLFDPYRATIPHYSPAAIHPDHSGDALNNKVWCFVNGFATVNIEPMQYAQWLREMSAKADELLWVKFWKRHLQSTVRAFVIVLWPESGEFDRALDSCLTRIMQTTEVACVSLVTGDQELSQELRRIKESQIIPTCLVPLSINRFFQCMAHNEPPVEESSPDNWILPNRSLTFQEKQLYDSLPELTLVHRNIGGSQNGVDFTDEDQDFLRGGAVTWANIKNGRTIKRDLEDTIIRSIVQQAESPRRRLVDKSWFEAYPSSGATTFIRQVAYALREKFPCAIVHSNSPKLAEYASTISRLTGLPMLLFCDHDFTSGSDLIRAITRLDSWVLVVLVVRPKNKEPVRDRRVTANCQKSMGCLTQQLSTPERKAFISFCQQHCDLQPTEDPMAQLEKRMCVILLWYWQQQCLYVPAFVANHLNLVSDENAKNWLCFFALAHFFGGVSIPDSVSLGRRVPGKATLGDFCPKSLQSPILERMTVKSLVTAEGYELLSPSFEMKDGAHHKTVSSVIAEEILKYFHGGTLPPMSVLLSFVNMLSRDHNELATKIIFNVFVMRSFEQEDRFSPLVCLLPNNVETRDFLLALESKFEWHRNTYNHLRAHRARFLSIKREDYKAALDVVERLDPKDLEQDNHLAHIKATIIRYYIRECSLTLPELAEQGVIAYKLFEQVRTESDSRLHGLISEARLLKEIVRAAERCTELSYAQLAQDTSCPTFVRKAREYCWRLVPQLPKQDSSRIRQFLERISPGTERQEVSPRAEFYRRYSEQQPEYWDTNQTLLDEYIKALEWSLADEPHFDDFDYYVTLVRYHRDTTNEKLEGQLESLQTALKMANFYLSVFSAVQKLLQSHNSAALGFLDQEKKFAASQEIVIRLPKATQSLYGNCFRCLLHSTLRKQSAIDELLWKYPNREDIPVWEGSITRITGDYVEIQFARNKVRCNKQYISPNPDAVRELATVSFILGFTIISLRANLVYLCKKNIYWENVLAQHRSCLAPDEEHDVDLGDENTSNRHVTPKTAQSSRSTTTPSNSFETPRTVQASRTTTTSSSIATPRTVQASRTTTTSSSFATPRTVQASRTTTLSTHETKAKVFHRTKTCSHWGSSGACSRGSKCAYAHSHRQCTEGFNCSKGVDCPLLHSR